MNEFLGPPAMEWLYRQNRQLIYEIDGNPVTFTLDNGRVNEIGQLAERRFHRRLEPTETTRVIIRTDNSIFEGVIDDVSERSIAITITNVLDSPEEQVKVTICTQLRTSQLVKKCIVLEGKIHSRRNSASQKKIIIIFTQKGTHSHQILREFINYHLAVLSLKGHIALPNSATSGQTTIKSDWCGYCPDQLCEKTTNFHFSKEF
ncbi:hypothetical protein FO488_00175 [Geobacter sp. FeAm09]|uniref:hypothetical protein n=1 Tax=Geobacter sp. FeAm09 TaxID=2597769 RepID=UPI0011EED01F|nr:hypothetical protein [Geobacter sp. FeAm09]QEM66724.1 hypothetical protein FO488_00175 [Geobacter sp. FeAm09]